jgi:hypothetical protein
MADGAHRRALGTDCNRPQLCSYYGAERGSDAANSNDKCRRGVDWATHDQIGIVKGMQRVVSKTFRCNDTYGSDRAADPVEKAANLLCEKDTVAPVIVLVSDSRFG